MVKRLQHAVPQWVPQVSQGCAVLQMLVELRSDAPDHDPARASLFKPGSNELVGHSISRRRGYHYL